MAKLSVVCFPDFNKPYTVRLARAMARPVFGKISQPRKLQTYEYPVIIGMDSFQRDLMLQSPDFLQVDYGYLGHRGTFWRVSRGGLFTTLDHEPDFFKAQKIEKDRHRQKLGSQILIALQSGKFYQNWMGGTEESFLARVLEELPEKHHQSLMVREKPRRSKLTRKVSAPPISEDLKEAFHVVTYSSAVALDALRVGVPVTVLDETHPAHEFSVPLSQIEKGAHSVDQSKVTQLFAKLAVAQWTSEELSRGKAWEFFGWGLGMRSWRGDKRSPPERRFGSWIEKAIKDGILCGRELDTLPVSESLVTIP